MFTKCGLQWDESDPMKVSKRNLHPDRIRTECDASLRRLGVERIDLYQFHWPDESGVPVEDSWDAMARLIEEGKVRAAGVSNFGVALLERRQPFQVGDAGVGRIGLGAAAVMLDLGQILPGDFRMAPQHFARQGVLDADAFGCQLFLVEAADTAIGGQARVGGDAGAGDEENTFRCRYQGGNFGEVVVGVGHGWRAPG